MLWRFENGGWLRVTIIHQSVNKFENLACLTTFTHMTSIPSDHTTVLPIRIPVQSKWSISEAFAEGGDVLVSDEICVSHRR